VQAYQNLLCGACARYPLSYRNPNNEHARRIPWEWLCLTQLCNNEYVRTHTAHNFQNDERDFHLPEWPARLYLNIDANGRDHKMYVWSYRDYEQPG